MIFREMAWTTETSNVPYRAEAAYFNGIEFFYVIHPDSRFWMNALLFALENENTSIISKADRQTIRQFLLSDGKESLPGQETVAVTIDDRTCWLSVQFILVGSTPLLCARDITDQMSVRAQRDAVTGAHTRESFCEQLTAIQPRDGTLVVIRIGQLGRVNDTMGSLAGDQILREQAKTLSVVLREGEVLGRYGGAEFLLYLQKTSRDVLEDRLRVISRLLTMDVGEDLKVYAHLGAVQLEQEDGEFDDLHEKAGLALRSIRGNEEGGFSVYTPDMKVLRDYVADLAQLDASSDSRVYIRTFGYFDVFVDDKPIHFQGGQAKELMALLVDRRGGYLSSGEAIACLWENEPANKTTLTRLRKVAMRLKNSLEEAGIADIIQFNNGERRVVPERFSCDYYEFLKNGRGAVFPGSYMTNYSWAEATLANLLLD